MTAVIVMIISTSLFPLLLSSETCSWGFQQVETSPPRMLKSQAFFVHVRAQLLWFTNYRTHDRGTTPSVSGSNVQIMSHHHVHLHLPNPADQRNSLPQPAEGPVSPSIVGNVGCTWGQLQRKQGCPPDVQPCEKTTCNGYD